MRGTDTDTMMTLLDAVDAVAADNDNGTVLVSDTSVLRAVGCYGRVRIAIVAIFPAGIAGSHPGTNIGHREFLLRYHSDP